AAKVSSAAAIAAVDPIGVDGVAAAALEDRHGRLEAAAPRVLIGNDLHAGESLEDRHRIAALHRDEIHLLAIDGGGDRGGGGRGGRGLRVPLDGLADAADLKLDFRDRKTSCGGHAVALLHKRTESANLDWQGVSARRHRPKEEFTRLIG